VHSLATNKTNAILRTTRKKGLSIIRRINNLITIIKQKMLEEALFILDWSLGASPDATSKLNVRLQSDIIVV